jgi:hypothetical protein
MLVQKQKKDVLTKLEMRVHATLCYASLGVSLICLLWNGATKESEKILVLIVEFIFLAVAAIFGFAIKHDTRVLDLRRFKK